MAINLAQFSGSGGGFGQGAYNRAKAAGFSDAQIKAALPSAGLKIGSAVSQSLGGDTQLYRHRGKAGQFGLTSYQNAIAAGMTHHNIRQSLAASGLRIGDKAAQALNINEGMTYLGSNPNLRRQSSFGASGIEYPARAVLAPRGYGLNNPAFSSDKGYSPTVYISGGSNDYDTLNFLFGTDYQGGPDIGTGYYDPEFHKVNEAAAANLAANMSILPTQKMEDFDYTMPAFNYSVPNKSFVTGVKSAGSSRNKGTSTLGRSTAGGMQINNLNALS